MLYTIFGLVAGSVLLVAAGHTLVQFGYNLGAGYEYVPHWFADHIWIVGGAFLIAWAVAPRRNALEVVAFAVMLLFPMFLFILNGGQRAPFEGTPWGMADDFRHIGDVFAYGQTAVVIAYSIYAAVARMGHWINTRKTKGASS